ncbi:hypothetical protein [Novosphingopyxis sp.]|uniref:hypothetical protein n=1 Tax=Novosphingopyxis sp. TaxID=2709690 RepID=UPI003B59F2A1
MMKKHNAFLLGLSAVATMSGAALAAKSAFSLQTLEKGQWSLRDKENGFKTVKRICLGDPQVLIQLRHLGQSCAVKRLNGDARQAMYSYRCRGAQGSTTIRRETDRLVQIRSQGLDHGAPFAFDYEARKTGGC